MLMRCLVGGRKAAGEGGRRERNRCKRHLVGCSCFRWRIQGAIHSTDGSIRHCEPALSSYRDFNNVLQSCRGEKKNLFGFFFLIGEMCLHGRESMRFPAPRVCVCVERFSITPDSRAGETAVTNRFKQTRLRFLKRRITTNRFVSCLSHVCLGSEKLDSFLAAKKKKKSRPVSSTPPPGPRLAEGCVRERSPKAN